MQSEVASYLTEHHYGVQDLTERSDLHYFLYLRDSARPLLDVGCNVGNLLSIDTEHSVGVDVDPKAIEICRQRGFTAEVVDLNGPLPFADGTFGTVHCRHVIEHVWEPMQLMREIRRVLRPGGRLVLLTPDFRYAFRTFYDDHTHLRPLTEESLRRLALDSGFADFMIQHEVSRVGLRQLVRRGTVSPALGARLYHLAYRLGIRQRKTMLLVGTAA
ncbi:MAG TPA: class I SAM-dependent methyltransferase [Gaiellaceae bacterium]|jgi:SAM-dependent methyltransferase